MSMENQEIKIDKNDFIRLSRSILSAYVDGLLLQTEMVVLIWLWTIANPRTGRAMVSYESLMKDFKGRYSKNHINKIMLSLKRKKLVWFPSQQGRRGSFHVDIHNYPLSTGGFKELSTSPGENFGRSSDNQLGSNQAGSRAEVTADWQKLKEAKMGLAEGFSMGSRSSFGRSSNNDNEKENYKERSYFQKSFDRMPISGYAPRTYEESRCLEIAKYLGEKDMTFILSVLKRHGFPIIEQIYIEIKDKRDSIRNRGAYFNAEVERLTKEKYT